MNPGHGSDLATLYAEVYARPEDDDLRWVLADALMAVGDPRGEFIVMQLQPTRDPGQREMRLRQQFGLTWMGPLRGAVIPLAYRRGFLTSCLVAIEVPDALRDANEWATIEHVELATDLWRADFLAWPMLRSLRTVTGVREIHIPIACGVEQVREISLRDGGSLVRDASRAWIERP